MNRILIIGAVFFMLIAWIVHRNHVAHDNVVKAQEEMTQRRAQEANELKAEAEKLARLKQQRDARAYSDQKTEQAITFINRDINKYQTQTSQIGEYNQVLIKLRVLLERWKYTSDPTQLQAIKQDINDIPTPECLNDAKNSLSTTLGNESSGGNEEETRAAFKVFLTEFNLCVREVTARKN